MCLAAGVAVSVGSRAAIGGWGIEDWAELDVLRPCYLSNQVLEFCGKVVDIQFDLRFGWFHFGDALVDEGLDLSSLTRFRLRREQRSHRLDLWVGRAGA